MMRYPPGLLDEIRARLPVSQIVARKVDIRKSGREFRGLSPFKAERTPSFFVNDQKGFYHCFATGEHGDIFTFLMKTEGLSFPEAVERLAEDAGVALPKPTEMDREREDFRQRLYRLMEETQGYFRASLASAKGLSARDYLDRRGLRPSTIDTFGIGFAPEARDGLKSHLGRLGFSIEEMITGGVVIGGSDIAVPYDRFRNRVMFPIADLKGRVIAFGGRALDPNQPAKYHNSPETPLFHKGANLYNVHRARPLAFEHQQIIVVEGYMDVVALSEAGFGQAVAPLGTALTEEQIQAIWRMVPEPVLCFDGDSAGRKAAYRAVEIMLPHLKPGASGVFAFLPEGLDPDDLVRQQGREAMASVLKRARPLDDVLFEKEWAAGEWSTPERRAQLEKRLKDLTGRIADSAVRGHYERAMRERLFKAWGQSRFGGGPLRPADGRGRGGQRQGNKPGRSGAVRSGTNDPGSGRFGGLGDRSALAMQASESLKRSGLVAGDAVRPPYREALLIGCLINHPWLLSSNIEQIAALELTSSATIRLRDALVPLAAEDKSLDTDTVRTQLNSAGLQGALDIVERVLTHRSDKFLDLDAEPAEVDMGWRHTLAVHEHHVGLHRELTNAERAFHDDGSDTAWSRICEIKALLARPEVMEFPSDT